MNNYITIIFDFVEDLNLDVIINLM